MAGPNDDINVNMNNLLLFAGRVMDTILNSIEQCPFPFRVSYF
jgi:hypothetical protein